MIYNIPKTKEEQTFLKTNRLGLEWTRRVKGGKRFSSNGDLDRVAGNGQYGFTTKRPFVNITKGLDGQYVKSRKTACRPRKNICRLATNESIRMGAIDSDIFRRKERLEKQEQETRMRRKIARAKNRNPRARKGNK